MSATPVPSTRDLPWSSQPPDLCAVFAGRRFRLLPVERRSYIAAAEVSFDLWESGGEVLARQHGTAPAEPEIARLTRWASERGVRLRVGASAPPLAQAAIGGRTGCEVSISNERALS